jgi:hypothetical protein
VRLFIFTVAETFSKLTATAMRLTDLPEELLSAILELVEDFRSIVLTNKTFHRTVARIETRRVIKTFEGLRSIATADSTSNLLAADINIQRATKIVGGLGITLKNCNHRRTVKPEERNVYRREAQRKKAKHLISALLLCFHIPGRWIHEPNLVNLGSELKKVLGMCVKAQNWWLASGALEPLGMLPKFTVDYGSLPDSVSAWIMEHMGSLSYKQLAGASDVLRLIDTNPDMTLLAGHIRSRVKQSNVMWPEPLLLLQDVSSPIFLMTRFMDTLRELHHQKDWVKLEKLLKLLVRLPDLMRHSDMIKLVQEISRGFSHFLDNANVTEAVSNLAYCEHILVEELKPRTIISIVKYVEECMGPKTSLGSKNHRVLQNLPSKSELKNADFETIRKLLREQLLNSVGEIRNCYDLHFRLDILYRLPAYLNILDDVWINDASFTQRLRQLPDQSRTKIVLSYYMPITACEGIEQPKQTVHLHRRHLIRCIRDRQYRDATTALERIRDRLFNVEIVKTGFLDIVEKLHWRSLSTQTMIEEFNLPGKPWQFRVRYLFRECYPPESKLG